MSDVVVWFDGACPLCRREIALMRRLDRRRAISFVDVAGAVASEGAACPLDRPTLLARFHVLEGGRVVSGAAAFAAMWRCMPLLRPLGLACRIPWVLAALEQLYGLFLRIRPTLQRSVRRLEPGAAA